MATRLTETRLTERRILQGLLVLMGISAIVIGAALFLFGGQFNHLSETSFDALRGQPSTSIEPISASADSELRFYAPFWLSYGVVMIWVGRNIVQRLQLVPILAVIFLTGGVGRILSLLSVGAPHPFYTALMMIELTYPLIIGFLYFRLRE